MPRSLKCCVPVRRNTDCSENSEECISTEADVLNEEFQCYMRVAKSLSKTLKRPKDVEICQQLMRKSEKLNRNSNLEVKRYTNIFFKFFLKVLNWTSANQPYDIYEKWYHEEDKMETSMWLEEQKSYLAVKSMCDGSMIVYSAISKNPCAGWEEGGLKALVEQCEKR